MASLDKDLKNNLISCLFGDGDMAKQYGVEDSMTTINEFFDAVD